MIGPGKYDDVCTMAREQTEAQAAIVIIVGGKYGQGFSCQATDPRYLANLPAMLELMAKQIREDMK